MSLYIEDFYPPLKDGINTLENVSIAGNLSVAGSLSLTGTVAGTTVFASYVGQTTEAATDRVFFVATRALTVVAISQSHAVAAGGVSTLQVVKDTGTTAPGAGTDLLATPFDLNATANTVQNGSLSATASDLALVAGNRLAIDFANTIQSTAGLCVTVEMKLA